MKREWITDTSKMNFTEEELNIVNKVIDFTDTILYYNGKDYKTEDPSDTYYFTSKDLLMEDMNYNYTELEKEGVFDEEEEAAVEESRAEEETIPYKAKTPTASITYNTTEDGCKAFDEDMWADINKALDSWGELPPIVLTVGKRQIRLIDCPLVYESISELLKDMVEEYITDIAE